MTKTKNINVAKLIFSYFILKLQKFIFKGDNWGLLKREERKNNKKRKNIISIQKIMTKCCYKCQKCYDGMFILYIFINFIDENLEIQY